MPEAKPRSARSEHRASLKRRATAASVGLLLSAFAVVAALVALVLPEPEDQRMLIVDRYDLGQATYAMMLAAADLGIGSGHSSVGDQDKARAILGVPGDHLVAYLIGLGYPAGRPLAPIATPDRRPLGEVIHHGRW